mmetsp:Transcript_105151/g.206237  ORF Transcript_105151/g.206237 Transcript_105151/m.206237 type:complete len:367 (+) Transcript_105151:2690-3790(+)
MTIQQLDFLKFESVLLHYTVPPPPPPPLHPLVGECTSFRRKTTQVPPLRDLIQQKDQLQGGFGPIFAANTDFKAIGRVGKALKAATAAVTQQPLSEEDYLTLRDRHAALVQKMTLKCAELAEVEDYDSLEDFAAKLEQLKALDVSALPERPLLPPAAAAAAVALPSTTPHKVPPATAEEGAELRGECDTLNSQIKQVPPLRDLILQKGELEKERDAAKSSNNYLALGKVGRALKMVVEQIAGMSVSEEDYVTLRDKHAALVERVEAKCRELAAAHDFDSLLLLAAKLEELKALDVAALPQYWINDPVMPPAAPAAAEPSTPDKDPDWINDPVLPPASQEEDPEWINDPVLPPADAEAGAEDETALA